MGSNLKYRKSTSPKQVIVAFQLGNEIPLSGMFFPSFTGVQNSAMDKIVGEKTYGVIVVQIS